MSSRELRQLIEDNEAWLSRPENEGQATIVHRLRSSQTHQGRYSANHGQQSFTNSGTETRRRCARTRGHHRGQEISTARSRSPLSRVPVEPSRTTGDSSWDDGQASGSSATTTAFEFQLPNTILQSRTPREVLAPGRTIGANCRNDGRQASESATTTIEFVFVPPNLISPNSRLREGPAPGRTTSGSAGTNIEYQPLNLIPPRVRFSEVPNVNNTFNMLIQLQRMGVMRRPMPQVQPQTPPAQNSAFQEPWHSQPRRRALQIDTFPTRNITAQEDAGSCVICMTEYETGEQVRVLPCNHSYHQSCILTWLQSNPRCPLCRSNCFR